MLNRMYTAAMPIIAPVPTTTTVAPKLRPIPTGPVQLGGRANATAGRVILANVHDASNPARAGLLPTILEGGLMFFATRKLSMHCSQLCIASCKLLVQ